LATAVPSPVAAALSDRERYTLVRSREYLPAETFITLVACAPCPSARKMPAARRKTARVAPCG